jgi:hypothetical protein
MDAAPRSERLRDDYLDDLNKKGVISNQELKARKAKHIAPSDSPVFKPSEPAQPVKPAKPESFTPLPEKPETLNKAEPKFDEKPGPSSISFGSKPKTKELPKKPADDK